jgi:PAS domain S-box-containing protein
VKGETSLDDFFARIHPDDVGLVRAADVEAAKNGQSLEIEYRMRGSDGGWIWVHDRSMPVHDASGSIVAWHGVLLDVTAQKRLETALFENEARLRLLVEQLPVALFSVNLGLRMSPGPGTHYTYVSPQFDSLTGMSPAEIARGTEAYMERIHPEDVEAVRAFDRQLGATPQPYEIAYRLRRADGEWVWLQERATLARDARGNPVAWNGVLIDISTQRRLEDSLRESEARFRSTFEGAAVGMALCTPDCRVLIANPALERLLGFAPGELNGCDSDLLTHPDDLAGHVSLRQRLQRGELGSYQLEKRYARKDGRYLWVILNVTAIRDERGTLRSVIGQVEDITGRKEAEEALRQSEARFRSTFEGAGIGMSLADLQGRFFDANPAFCQFLGYSRDELTRMTYLDITHSDDRDVSLDYTRRLFKEGFSGFSIEKRYVRADGRTVWGHLTITTVSGPDGNPLYEIAQVQDITARKEAEAALRESEARFRALVQNDPDVIGVVDQTMHISYLSPAALAAIGVPPDRLVGEGVDRNFDRVHQDDLGRVLALFERIGPHHGASASAEARIRHADQSWRWFQITVTNLLEDPGIAGYLFNLRDITERKRAELATAAALKTQQAAIAELERLNRSKSRFLSTISHEFRTPLTAIIGYSEFIYTNAADPALVADDAAVIHREASRLNRMVDDVLLIDRVDARQMTLVLKPVDPNAIVREVVETFRPLTEHHELTIDLDPDARQVDGDFDRLSQALTNLVSNAIKYAPDGGAIAIATRNQGDDVVISVRDSGIGIAAEDVERIFERFERVETGIAGRIAGTGLGLSIVREIANLHGGRVWTESAPGVGSTFFLAIPAWKG